MPKVIKREMNEQGLETYLEFDNGDNYKFEYDKFGNKTYIEKNKGQWAKYEYDEHGNETFYQNYQGITRGVPNTNEFINVFITYYNDLDNLCKRLQDEYNGNVEFVSDSQDRLALCGVLDAFDKIKDYINIPYQYLPDKMKKDNLTRRIAEFTELGTFASFELSEIKEKIDDISFCKSMVEIIKQYSETENVNNILSLSIEAKQTLNRMKYNHQSLCNDIITHINELEKNELQQNEPDITDNI